MNSVTIGHMLTQGHSTLNHIAGPNTAVFPLWCAKKKRGAVCAAPLYRFRLNGFRSGYTACLAALPTRMRSTSGAISAARCLHSSSVRLDRGCWATTNSYSGTPIIRVMALAVFKKTWVMMDAVGIPSLSISIPSCTLHELQDPQSPIPVIKTSTLSSNC